jgi:PST family polysaccharide transporter
MAAVMVEETPGTDPPLGSRVVRGSIVLTLRTGVVYAVTGIGSIVLTKLLVPSDFGAFSIVFSLSVFVYAASTYGFNQLFVRENVSDVRVVDAAFWAMCAVSTLFAAIAVGIALVLGHGEPLLLAGFATFVILTPFRFPALLECSRTIRFVPLAIIEIIETITLQGVTIVAAVAGLGVRSFGLGLIAAGVVAAVQSLIVRGRVPRPAGLHLVRPWLRPLAPVETSVVVSSARETLTFPLLGAAAGTTAVGLFSWAYTVALLPVLLATIAAGALFTAFSRLRDRPAELAEALSRSIRLLMAGSVLLAVPVCAAIEPIISVVFSPRWLPARETVWILAGGAVVYAFGLVLAQAIAVTSEGATSVSHWQLLMTLILWGIGLPVAASAGIEGFALAYCAGSVVFVSLTLRRAHRSLHTSAIVSALACAAAGLIAAIVGHAAASGQGRTWAGLLTGASISLAIYGALLVVVSRGPLGGDLALAFRLLRGRSGALHAGTEMTPRGDAL